MLLIMAPAVHVGLVIIRSMVTATPAQTQIVLNAKDMALDSVLLACQDSTGQILFVALVQMITAAPAVVQAQEFVQLVRMAIL